jgi:hypothetical protein
MGSEVVLRKNLLKAAAARRLYVQLPVCGEGHIGLAQTACR